MTEPRTITRNAELSDLVATLRGEQPRKYDLVVPAKLLRAELGRLVLSGTEAILTDEGVGSGDGVYRPTRIADDGIADRLGIPPGYLNTMRHKALGLYDDNVNGWLAHDDYAAKNFMVRLLRSEPGSEDLDNGVVRAFLSDHYKPIENLDVLMTVLEGIGAAGVEVRIAGADLTDRRMYVRVVSEQIRTMAPTLLAGYRSPFTGASGVDNPVVFAGFEVSNSEVGLGAFSIAPRIVIQVCDNGATWRDQAVRAQHLGGRLETGQVTWSDETQDKNLALIKSKAADAVRQFLDQEWLERTVAKLEQAAGVEVTKPEETIKVVAQKLRYTEAQQDDIMRMFIKGGQTTAGGVMQAVTASAQNQTDADLAADMEADAAKALEFAAAHARS